MEADQRLNSNRFKSEENDFLEKLRRSLDLRLDDEGRFIYEGDIITHPKVHALFHRSICMNPKTKEYYLQIGDQIAYFQVDSFAFFITQFEFCQDDSSQSIKIILNQGEVLIDAIDSLYSVDFEKIYVQLKDQRKCGVLKKAREQMLAFLETLDVGQEQQFVLKIGSSLFKINELSSLDELKIKD
jgi:hypothetical protein